jgi:hypothetical protein
MARDGDDTGNESWWMSIKLQLKQAEQLASEADHPFGPSVRNIEDIIKRIENHPNWPSARQLSHTPQFGIWDAIFVEAGDLVDELRDVHHKALRSRFALHLSQTMNMRTLFITEEGYVGVAHYTCEKGNEVWILLGGRVPYVLSPMKPDAGGHIGFYIFGGDCYVHGIMEGEFLREKLDDQETEISSRGKALNIL